MTKKINNLFIAPQPPLLLKCTAVKLKIIYAKKLLNSEWLRKECSSSVTRVQSNTSVKRVTRVQITNGFRLAENTNYQLEPIRLGLF